MDADTLRAFTAVALVLPGFFFVGFGNFLVARSASVAVAAVVTTLLLLGILGHLSGRFSLFLTLVLVLPAYQYAIFHALRRFFVWRVQRPPQTAALNFASGILPDRLFNVALLVLTVLLPVFGVAYMSRP